MSIVFVLLLCVLFSAFVQLFTNLTGLYYLHSHASIANDCCPIIPLASQPRGRSGEVWPWPLGGDLGRWGLQIYRECPWLSSSITFQTFNCSVSRSCFSWKGTVFLSLLKKSDDIFYLHERPHITCNGTRYLTHYFSLLKQLEGRTNVNLKDKYRNMYGDLIK